MVVAFDALTFKRRGEAAAVAGLHLVAALLVCHPHPGLHVSREQGQECDEIRALESDNSDVC